MKDYLNTSEFSSRFIFQINEIENEKDNLQLSMYSYEIKNIFEFYK